MPQGPAGFGERAQPTRLPAALAAILHPRPVAHLRRQLNGVGRPGRFAGKSALARRRGMGRLSGGGGCGRRQEVGMDSKFSLSTTKACTAGRPPGRGRCRTRSPQTSGCRGAFGHPFFVRALEQAEQLARGAMLGHPHQMLQAHVGVGGQLHAQGDGRALVVRAIAGDLFRARAQAE